MSNKYIMFKKGGDYILNQVILVGRLVKDPELHETDSNYKVTRIVLAVPRSFKNSSGVYDTDFVPCIIWRGVAENVCEYCKKGDLIGIKGHIETGSYDDSEGNKKYTLDIIVEKVTFLSGKKEA